MNDNQFKNLLAFCVLMGDGVVLSKSPDYIKEKYNRYIGQPDIPDDDMWKSGLHLNLRTGVFDEYLKYWNIK